jgi:hypothetical protein
MLFREEGMCLLFIPINYGDRLNYLQVRNADCHQFWKKQFLVSLSVLFEKKCLYFILYLDVVCFEIVDFFMVMVGEFINVLNTLDDITLNEFFIFLPNSNHRNLYFVNQPLKSVSDIFDLSLACFISSP